MSDSFHTALGALVAQGAGVDSAALTDLDGEDIAVTPRQARDNLRLCAAYGGIALRRLGQIEAAAGRAPVTRISMIGTDGRFLAVRVAGDYQLVALAGPSAVMARATEAARATATITAASL